MSALAAGRPGARSSKRSTQYTCHGKVLLVGGRWRMQSRCAWQCRSICLHESGDVDIDNLYSMETAYRMTFPCMQCKPTPPAIQVRYPALGNSWTRAVGSGAGWLAGLVVSRVLVASSGCLAGCSSPGQVISSRCADNNNATCVVQYVLVSRTPNLNPGSLDTAGIIL